MIAKVIYTIDDTTQTMRVIAGYIAVQTFPDGRAFILAADGFGGRLRRRVHLARCWVVDVEVDGGD